jgi:hypothetical protein
MRRKGKIFDHEQTRKTRKRLSGRPVGRPIVSRAEARQGDPRSAPGFSWFSCLFVVQFLGFA